MQRVVHGNSITGILTDSQTIHNKEMAEMTFATFTSDSTNETMDIQLHPNSFFKSNEEYSFTLVGTKEDDIESLSTKLAIRPLQLQRIAQRDVYKVKTVAIAQYPDGKSKWLSLARIYEIQTKYILYDANASAGCFGSPVFYACNEDCYVIALHVSANTPMNKGVFINHILDHVYGDPVQLLQIETKPIFSSQEIIRIARKMSIKWELIALATGKFHPEEIANIRQNRFHEDNVIKATRMLTDYQNRQGSREDLASAIKETKELDLAEKVLARYFLTNSD